MNDNAHNNSDEAVIIVFGRQGHAKTPRAAWFREEAIVAARKAAEELGFEFLTLRPEDVQNLIADIPEGRFAISGRAQIPAIAPSLHEKLTALLTATPETGAASSSGTESGPRGTGERSEASNFSPFEAAEKTSSQVASPDLSAEIRLTNAVPIQQSSAEAILPAVIVFGRKDLGRARAGWFTIAEAALACKAAQSHEFRWLPVRTKDEHLAASRISRGQLHGNLTLVLPTVPAATLELLNRLSAKAEKTGAAFPEGSPGRSHPVTWDEIGIGDVVLASSEDGSWWEAKILNRIDDQFVIVWREDPDQPVVICSIQDIALLHPSRA